MGIKLTNNAFGTLASGINSSATSITLTTGQGARFPTLSAGDYFYATLVDTSNNLEIVKCTARSTDVLTVVRAQENTTARAYSTGDRIEIRLTAQTFVDAAGVTSSDITTALGYTPANKAGDTFTGTVNAPKVYVNSPTSTWATDLFPLVVKGLGDGGFRGLGVVGSASESSSWFGSTNTPQFAIDTANGSAAFWLNNGTTSLGSWFKMIDFSYNGTTNFYGGNGGAAISVRNGGDIQVYSAGGGSVATMWADGVPTGSGTGNSEMMWFGSLSLRNQRCTYDRSWDNYPSITVLNHTDQGPQGEFRVHGANGVSGGDFSVTMRCDGGYITGSDARRKTNIEPIQNALQTVTQLQGKKFNIINREGDLDPMRGDKKQYGFIAQECENIIPDAVTFYPDENTPNEHGWASAYAIDYASLVPMLVEAIKEQQQQIETLKTEVAALKAGA